MRQLLNNWMIEQRDTKKVFQTPYPITRPRPHELGIK